MNYYELLQLSKDLIANIRADLETTGKNCHVDELDEFLTLAYTEQKELDYRVLVAEEVEDGDLDLLYLELADLNDLIEQMEKYD